MRRGGALFLGLLATLLAGCATAKQVVSTSWMERLHPFRGPTGADVIQMDVALLVRPVGDPYINKELWTYADEQTVPLERKAVLEENGFRVCQVGGLTPAGLQTLLTSEKSCVNPRRLFVRAGNPTQLALGPTMAQCRFRIRQDGPPVAVSRDQAECLLQVVPSPTNDGRTHLQITPQIRHGETGTTLVAAKDGSGWIMQTERPTETLSTLSWEVTLAANEYLVVGARNDRPEALGYQCFFRRDETIPVQRLLVIRAWRASGPAPDGLTDPAEKAASRPLPLALQAAWTTVRGTAQ
jgi:hypothetical protein